MQTEKTYWDPTGVSVLSSDVLESCQKLQQQAENYLKKHASTKLIYTSLYAPFVFGIIFVCSTIFFGQGVEWFLFIPVAILLSFPFMYKSHLQKRAKAFVRYELAKKEGWLYKDEKDEDKWHILAGKAAPIFRRGDKSQFVRDQLWGSLTIDNTEYNFWQGDFSFTEEGGRDADGNKNPDTIVVHTVMAIQLPVLLRTDCLISRKFGGMFQYKYELDTESVEFNDEFHCRLPLDDMDARLAALELLNPAVQSLLLDKLSDEKFMMLCKGDTIFLSIGVNNFSLEHTNFLETGTIDVRDIESASNHLKSLFSIIAPIASYLD